MFTSATDRDRHDHLRHKQIVPCKCLSISVLAAFNIETIVTDYFCNIGSIGNFDITHCAYYKLVFEFYSTFHFQWHEHISLDTPSIIKFQLLGTTYSLSIIDFNIALAFVSEESTMSTYYENSLCTFPIDFKAIEAFALLTDNVETMYSLKTSKDLWFRNPTLCYIHRYLAYNFSGRQDDPATVSKWNYSYYGVYTPIVQSNAPISDLHVACQADPLDAHCLDSIGLLLSTPFSFHFVPPGVRSSQAERIFRQQNQHDVPNQERPPMTIEQCLERIEALLDTLGQQMADLIAALRE
ncbi:hypothetical protein PVK06_018084 [Gossypium arboreum]|uniref:Arabidopsis retrotransposon Orf1 C-terminal domain-containing protein n=1 Tax=Gossypium arboreum TaxID=29729 RepID=A0ABR0Q4I1_GOSAR|nr:hypothetical protein PVK06_018084 [Gossypium arboreum]